MTTPALNEQLLTDSRARVALSAMPVARHWIGGQWRDSADHRDSINPASGEKIGAYAFGKEARWPTQLRLRCAPSATPTGKRTAS